MTIYSLIGNVCPPGFYYQFGTCSKILKGADKMENEAMCKENTMGTGKAFIAPHVSNILVPNYILYLDGTYIVNRTITLL